MSAQARRMETDAPGYCQQLGLQRAPFAPGLQPEFFYVDAERAQCLGLLQQVTRDNPLLLLMIGERGIGKTSLLQYFLAKSEDLGQVCAIEAHTLFDADQLLGRIAACFGLKGPAADPATLHGQLYQHLSALQLGRTAPLLIVDDADELGADALEALFHLCDAETAQGNKLLRVILAGETQIERLLQTPTLAPLRGRITHAIEIPPLSEERTAEYLRHRLHVAGFYGPMPFTAAAIRKLHKASEGVPARLNELAHALLAGEALDGSAPRRTPGMPGALASRRNLLVGTGVAALLLAGVFHVSGPSPTASVDPATGRRVVSLEVPPRTPAPQPVPSEVRQPPADAAQAPAPHLPTPDAGVGPEPAADATPAAVDADVVLAVAAPPQPNEPVTVADTAAPAPRPAATGEQRPAVAVETRPARVATPPSPPPAQPPRLHGDAWLQGRNPAHFAIQLLASQDQASLTAFVADHRLDGDFAVHRTLRDGRSWYALLLGDYPSRTQAEAAVGRLPRAIRENNPWIRRYADLQSTHVADAAAPTARDPAARDAWLWSQDPRHYTLQLLGTGSEQNVAAFIAAHGLHANTAYFRTQREGAGWYVLLHGAYPTREEAEQALHRLPGTARAHAPWIRTFGSVHAELPTASAR